jgi:hypothetical protein
MLCQGREYCCVCTVVPNSPKFSPPQMSIWASYFPRWLNQDLSITKIPPAMTGVLGVERGKKQPVSWRSEEPCLVAPEAKDICPKSLPTVTGSGCLLPLGPFQLFPRPLVLSVPAVRVQGPRVESVPGTVSSQGPGD